MNVASLISNSGIITVVIDGKVNTIQLDHPNYEAVKDCVKRNDYGKIAALIDMSSKIEKKCDNSDIKIESGVVSYRGTMIDNSLTKRIVKMMEEGFNIDPMIAFLNNLMQNPSFRAINELYTFLEHSKLPITEDGYFLAYKRVDNDYLDYHSHSVRYRIGDKPFMIRGLVDDDKNQTCSRGLHFCSLGYLANFMANQGHIMIVKINPKDVVSIPIDYNNTKGRCCEMEVIAEYEGQDPSKDIWDDSVVANNGKPAVKDMDVEDVDAEDAEDEDWEDDDDIYNQSVDEDSENNSVKKQTSFHNIRDAWGRFVKKHTS